MAIRTTMTTVTFKKPFSLGALNDPQPAGRYTVETDEERLEGLSFTAYRRVRTLIHIPSRAGRRAISEILVVDPSELEFALELDARLSVAPTDPNAEQKDPREQQEPAITKAADRQAIERGEDEGMAASSL